MRTTISLSLILTLAVTLGQLIKIPAGTHGGLTLLDLTITGLCLVGLFQTKLHLKKPPLFIMAAILFIGVAILSLALTPLNLTKLEYLTSFFYTIRFSLYILLGWLILSGPFPSLRKNLQNVLILSGVGLAALGLLQFIFLPDLKFLTSGGWDPHYFRTVSTFLDPNFAGAYFTLTLILLMSLRGPRAKSRGTKQSIWFCILVYLSLLTTFSRSSYLMFLISGLSLSFFKKSKTLTVKTIVLFLILLLGFQIYIQLVAKVRNIEREKSASFRLSTWQQGFEMIKKSPFFGIGYNSYRYALKEFNLGDEQFILRHGASSNDSSLLFVAATTGIIGLTFYLFFLFSLIKHAWRNNLILVSALLGLLIHSFFANSLFYPPILSWIILSAVAPKK